MTQTVLERVKQYIALSSTIRPDWEKFIKDKKHPLDDRWEAFLAAPSDWRQEYDGGDVPITVAAAKFNSPYDDFRIDLGEALDVDEIIDILAEAVDDGEFTDEELIACKEEAIKLNLGSWQYSH